MGDMTSLVLLLLKESTTALLPILFLIVFFQIVRLIVEFLLARSKNSLDVQKARFDITFEKKYERRFSAYGEIWGYINGLRNCLYRSEKEVGDSAQSAIKDLQTYRDNALDCILKHLPFYPDQVYQSLDAIINIADAKIKENGKQCYEAMAKAFYTASAQIKSELMTESFGDSAGK